MYGVHFFVPRRKCGESFLCRHKKRGIGYRASDDSRGLFRFSVRPESLLRRGLQSKLSSGIPLPKSQDEHETLGSHSRTLW